ncbi:hypothetical protein Lal_00038105 [Lupinus albus]|nr:hypothetical protein Lal_00038105 [Lupinus albus]
MKFKLTLSTYVVQWLIFNVTRNPDAKFKVGKFDGTGNFGLWQMKVKDVLAQQGLSKALSENEPDGIDQLIGKS